MKNLSLLPDDLQERVKRTAWECGCGQDGLRISITRKGSIQAHCFNCGLTVFFNDPWLFRYKNPFAIYGKEKPVSKKMASGGWTYWYPKARVRIFQPE